MDRMPMTDRGDNGTALGARDGKMQVWPRPASSQESAMFCRKPVLIRLTICTLIGVLAVGASDLVRSDADGRAVCRSSCTVAQWSAR